MNERLKELRKSLGLSQEEFAKRIGLKGGAISLIECGRRNITTQVVTATCREFGVNEEWLREGVGDMYVAAIDCNGSNFVLKTFKALGQLTPDEWGVLKKLVDKIIEA